MRLNDLEQAMLSGALGEPRRLAMDHLVQVARFFDAEDFVEVGQAHIMADSEALGEAGVAYLEHLAGFPRDQRRVRVPTITDPRGTDFSAYRELRQDPAFVDLERRAVRAFEALGVLMTNTCINYQTIQPPVFGQHLAFGDTGSVIYANSVCGARSNFEGGPAALAAALEETDAPAEARRVIFASFRVLSSDHGTAAELDVVMERALTRAARLPIIFGHELDQDEWIERAVQSLGPDARERDRLHGAAE